MFLHLFTHIFVLAQATELFVRTNVNDKLPTVFPVKNKMWKFLVGYRNITVDTN